MQQQQGTPGQQILQAGASMPVNPGDQSRPMAPVISMTEIQQQAMMQTLPTQHQNIGQIMPNGTISMVPPVPAPTSTPTAATTPGANMTGSTTHHHAAGTQTLKDDTVKNCLFYFQIKSFSLFISKFRLLFV